MPGRLRPPVGAAIAIAAVLLAAAQSAAADPLVSVAARAEAPVSELAQPTAVTVPGGGLVQRYQQRVGGLPVLGAEAVVAAPSGGAADRRRRLDRDRDHPPRRRRRRSRARARSTPARAATGSRAPAGAGEGEARDRPGTATGSPGRCRCPRRPRSPTTWSRSTPAPGEKLRSRDVLRHATGTAAIYNPNPVVQQGGYSGLRDRKDKDSRAAHLAAGDRAAGADHERARVASPAPTSTRGSASKGKKVCDSSLDFTDVTRSNNRFEALMAYFHIDRTRAYADSLGLSKPLRAQAAEGARRRDHRRQLVLLARRPTSWCSAPAASTTARTPT